MKSLLAITTALSALAFAAPTFAQESGTNDPVGEFRDVYLTDQDGSTRLVGGDFGTEGLVILGDTTYQRPADCPEGSFYWSGENTLTACGEGAASFDVIEPEAGATMSTGEAFPDGARVLSAREEERMQADDEDSAEDTPN